MWKLIDLQFPSHHWLELTDESEEELVKAIESHPIHGWEGLEEAGQIERDMYFAMRLIRQVNEQLEPDLQPQLVIFRNYLQEKAFESSAFLSPPTEAYFNH